MNRLSFEHAGGVTTSARERADIPCFVGFVGARARLSASDDIVAWLERRGWGSAGAARDVAALDDVPVPVESWSAFERLFAWDERTRGAKPAVATYLGAAVRSFFAQGGRKCYVVRVGDPWAVAAPRSTRIAAIARLLPGYPGPLAASPAEQASWRGAAHVFGLQDVSFLCMPDLGDAVAVDAPPPPPPPAVPQGEARFVECSEPEAAPPSDRALRALLAPRCDAAGYDAWAVAVRRAAELARAGALRDLEVLASIPLPHADAIAASSGRAWSAENDLHRFLVAQRYLTSPPDPPPAPRSAVVDGVAVDIQPIESAFVQLVYPWPRTAAAAERLPEGLESPDGVLAGVLARNALSRGTFRSAASLGLAEVQGVRPELGRRDLAPPSARSPGLADRVSILGPTPAGPRLLSDVTTAADGNYRSAAVSRLMSVLIREARHVGADTAFEPSRESTWESLRHRMERLLARLWEAGALRGGSEAEAFTVRCDRTTMSQADIDSGRVIARVVVSPVLSIERIHVILTVVEGGAVIVQPREAA
ncbi:phage tail sheath protein [Sorangium sp. So ce388]|uniref:phage tail sheath protein n=1 Tax=Sorangium sp. So ce388 TaxID=3133309 RepID=UPI003F5BC7EA